MAVHALKHRLAVVQSHAICYHGPFFRALAAHPEIDLSVFYLCPDFGLVDGFDGEIGRAYKWDVPVLDGYMHRVLPNVSPVAARGGFWSFVNPAVVTELAFGRYDAVVLHGYRLASEWLAFLAAGVSGTPILFRGETGRRPPASPVRRALKRLFVMPLLRRADACLAIGTVSRRYYEQHGLGDRVVMTPYAVDNHFFVRGAAEWRPRRDALRADLGVPPGVPVILQTSKLIPRKRPLDLVKAFERLDRPAALVFVGDGAERPALESYVAERRVPNVFFAGFSNQGRLPALYAMADIFVLPSEHDIFGLAINEAMCAALPIVTTRTVGAGVDLVREGENGFLYDAGDVDALVTRLRILVDDPARRASMGARSVEIISRWNYDVSVDAIVGTLNALRARAAPVQ